MRWLIILLFVAESALAQKQDCENQLAKVGSKLFGSVQSAQILSAYEELLSVTPQVVLTQMHFRRDPFYFTRPSEFALLELIHAFQILERFVIENSESASLRVRLLEILDSRVIQTTKNKEREHRIEERTNRPQSLQVWGMDKVKALAYFPRGDKIIIQDPTTKDGAIVDRYRNVKADLFVPSNLESLTLSPTSDWLVLQSRSFDRTNKYGWPEMKRTLYVVDPITGTPTELNGAEANTAMIRTVTSQDGSLVLAAQDSVETTVSGALVLWNIGKKEKVREFDIPEKVLGAETFFASMISPDNQWIGASAFGHFDDRAAAVVWNTTTGESEILDIWPSSVPAFSPDSQRILFFSDASLHVFELQSGSFNHVVYSRKFEDFRVDFAFFGKDSSDLLIVGTTASHEMHVKRVNMNEPDEISDLFLKQQRGSNFIAENATSTKGRHLLALSEGKSVFVYDIEHFDNPIVIPIDEEISGLKILNDASEIGIFPTELLHGPKIYQIKFLEDS
jgi:WD40 repeat protein